MHIFKIGDDVTWQANPASNPTRYGKVVDLASMYIRVMDNETGRERMIEYQKLKKYEKV